MIEAQSPLNLSASTSTQQYPKRSPGLPREKKQDPSLPRYLSVLMVNHDVVRFHISVHDSHAMAVI